MTIRVDTLGWDIAASIPLSAANGALAAAAGKLITAFDFTGDEEGASYRVAGTFGVWSILGGTGDLLDLAIPIQAGSFEFGSERQDLTGIVVRIRTRLRFVESLSEKVGAALMFAFDEHQPPTSAEAAAGIFAAALEPGHILTPEVAAILPTAVAACLARHMGQISFVFATLVPHDTLLPQQSGGAPHCAYLAHCPPDEPGSLVVLWAAARPDGAVPPAPVVPEALQALPDCLSVALSAELTVRQVLRQALALGLTRAQQGEQVTDIDPEIFVTGADGDGNNRLWARQPFELQLVNDKGARLVVKVEAMSLDVQGGLVTLGYNLRRAGLFGFSQTIAQSYTAYVGHHWLPGFRSPGLRLLATADTMHQAPAGREYGLRDLINNRGAVADVMIQSLVLPEKLKHGFDRVPVALGVTIFDDVSLSPDDGYLNGGILFHCHVPA